MTMLRWKSLMQGVSGKRTRIRGSDRQHHHRGRSSDDYDVVGDLNSPDDVLLSPTAGALALQTSNPDDVMMFQAAVRKRFFPALHSSTAADYLLMM